MEADNACPGREKSMARQESARQKEQTKPDQSAHSETAIWDYLGKLLGSWIVARGKGGGGGKNHVVERFHKRDGMKYKIRRWYGRSAAKQIENQKISEELKPRDQH